ncbi:ACT domain-containing protein [Marinobacter sp. F4216]|uniref:ACT domain-containing protein n=1 Tax=Marinobacter sp. F4216 TaxID=2874281 RepID=UPI001CC09B7A|nr:ACT domain-containing protein [Marinobacter sp. F4216]MBZ2167483.1 ACT domain-containing protein [Marinobacter sp. F4216]
MNPTTHPNNAGIYAIACTMTHEAAAMERLCQVIRIRGFRIVQMAVDAAGENLNIALTLEGTRPIAMLKTQLEKLHTVGEVVLQAPMAKTKTA